MKSETLRVGQAIDKFFTVTVVALGAVLADEESIDAKTAERILKTYAEKVLEIIQLDIKSMLNKIDKQ